MSLYMRSKDVNLINSLNKEIINNIIDTKVNIFKISLYDTKENLYGESINKIYFPGVSVAGLIEHEDESFDTDEFGTNKEQIIVINFHRETLKDINLYPEISDVVEYNNNYYEIDSTTENHFLGGNTNLSHSIVCNAHLTRKGIVLLDKIKRAHQENIDYLYK